MNRAIKEFIDHFKTGQKRRQEMFSYLDKLRGKFSTAVLGVNPVVYIKQLTSIPAMASDIPTTAFASGLTDFFLHPVKATRILQDSAFIQARYGKGHTRDVAIAMSKTVGQTVAKTDSLPSQLMFLTKLGDIQAIFAGGWAVYKYHKERLMKDGLTESQAHEQAIIKFEEVARDTQQSGEIMDMGLVQQAGPFAKLMTMFFTSPASYYREIAAAIRNMKKDPADSMKRLVLFWVIIPTIFEAIASGPLLFDDDDDDRALFFKRLMRSVALGAVNGLFIVRDIADYLYNQAFLKSESWGGPDFTSVTQTVNSTGRLVRELMKGVDEIDYGNMVEDVVDITGYMTGYPTPSVQNLVTGWRSIVNDETEHPIAKVIGYGNYATGDRR